jgi:Asp-tRNA(Asn)/Glu-tRNA(Gln) amidotransferase A subunit family amidase
MKDAPVEFGRYRGRLEATSILYIISRAELHAAMLASHPRYDLLLTPTMPVTALKVGLLVPDDGAFGDDWLNWAPYTYPFNLTQQPAASLAVGLACNGLPWAHRSSAARGRTRWCCGRGGRSSGRCRCRRLPATHKNN